MIVKVQVSLASSDGLVRMLIYNRAGDVTFEGELTPPIRRAMRNRPRAFFEAKLNDKGQIELGREVDERDW